MISYNNTVYNYKKSIKLKNNNFKNKKTAKTISLLICYPDNGFINFKGNEKHKLVIDAIKLKLWTYE